MPATSSALKAGAKRWAAFEGWIEGSRMRDLVAGSLLSAACLCAILLFIDLKTEGTALYADPGWDRHLYRLMAEEGPFEFRLAPYCWRILVPALAGWSPFGLQASFMGITLAALWGTGAALWAMARRRGHSATAAGIGVLLFYSLGWGAKFIAADFWIPDGVALLLVTLALWAALEKKLVLFALVMLAGAATKESVLLAAPLYLGLNIRRPLDWGWVARGAAVLIPAALVVVAIRLGVPHRNGDAAYLATLPGEISRFPELYSHYDYWRLLKEIGRDQRWRYWGFNSFLTYTTGPLGLALPLLAATGLRRSGRLALGMLPFFVLTYCQLLFATDTQRLIVLVAPCVVVLALEGMRELRLGARVSPASLMVPALVLFLLVLIGPRSYEVRFESQALIVGLTVAVLLASGLGRAPDVPPGPA